MVGGWWLVAVQYCCWPLILGYLGLEGGELLADLLGHLSGSLDFILEG